MFVNICLFTSLVVGVYGFMEFEREAFDKNTVVYALFDTALNSPMVLNCNQDRSLNLDVSNIKIYFFDFLKNFNTSFSINKAVKGILNIENLDKTRQFIMFVGGFTSNINHAIELQMREAYKKHPNSYLMIPDHSAYTNNDKHGNIISYEGAVTHVHYIGKALGQMWSDLKFGGVSPKNIHCVGHSLGGQILGHVGSTFLEVTGEKISRITALDPAGPCFVNSAIENQVRAGVAEYVEIYHCNAGALGSSSLLGDVDFIVNKNGETQPNCETLMELLPFGSSIAASCAHRTCVNLWTASVKTSGLFKAYSCDCYENFRKGKCLTNDKTVAGSGNPGKAKGLYFLSTKKYEFKSFMQWITYIIYKTVPICPKDAIF